MKSQSGNVLVFILIAIILIGLLTVSLTRSSNTTNDTGSYEQNQIAAAEILRYAKSIEVGVQNLLARGCGENELSFWHDSDGNGTEDASDDYYNPTAPTDQSCHLFQPAGMGLTYAPPHEDWLDTAESAETGYGDWFFTIQANIENDPVRSKALRIVLPYSSLNICTAVNKLSGINATLPPLEEGVAFNYDTSAHRYTGVVPSTGSFDGISSSDGALDGQLSGCFEGDTFPAGGYHSFHVLYAP